MKRIELMVGVSERAIFCGQQINEIQIGIMQLGLCMAGVWNGKRLGAGIGYK